jgi:hypothetical protein
MIEAAGREGGIWIISIHCFGRRKRKELDHRKGEGV